MIKIVFCGTPTFAKIQLESLVELQNQKICQILGVYTQPDRPKGRGQNIQFSDVKSYALENNLPLYQPINFKNESDVLQLQSLNADLLVVAAYGLILPQSVLDAYPMKAINVHASLLPRWRGAAPIHRAILEGDKTTGITLMKMSLGLDEGDMLTKALLDIEENDNTQTLHDKLAQLGAKTLSDFIKTLTPNSMLTGEIQNNELSNYAKKLTKEEGRIDWSKDIATISRQIRAYNPYPVAYSYFNGDAVRIFEARIIKEHDYRISNELQQKPGTVIGNNKDGLDVITSNGVLRIISIQLPSKKQMLWQSCFHNLQNHFTIGSHFE